VKNCFIFFVLICLTFSIQAQEKASLYGIVTDSNDGYPLIGVNVVVIGTSLGAATGLDGDYKIENITPGEYTIEVSYLGYEKLQITGQTFSAGEQKEYNIEMGSAAVTLEEEIVIIGDKPLIDIDDTKNKTVIDNAVIEAAPSRQIQSVINSQTGVVQNSEGIHIRGGRTYETGFFIDGVNASDPLSGTGFGIDIGTNSVSKVEVQTSASGVEYGDATAGVVNTKTKTGGDDLDISFIHKRDNFGFNSEWESTFNEQLFDLSVGGPVLKKALKNKFKFFTSARAWFTDEFTKNPAEQVTSSIYTDNRFSPFQDNRYSGLLKLKYDLTSRKKITYTYLKSLTINQNRNMLRVTGNDVSFSPGYQFNFHLQPDNASTYTHDTNMNIFQWQHSVSDRFAYNVTGSRLFVKLRSDANGRDWRPEVVDTEFDPESIVEFPASYFNPDDEIVFVNPAPGLFNNNGIATLWHDHFVEEYTVKLTGNIYSKNTFNKLYFGTEWKRQDLQWIDITRPWVGAPIPLANGETSQSFRLGDVSDIWRVQPVKGALFVANKIKYKGLVAEVGGRMEYWLPGKFLDDAIENPAAPIRDEVRDAYIENSIGLWKNRRMKMRLLPKISATFPIRENQMMYFNYSHSTVSPHPRDLYTGLDPFFSDQSTLGRLGNPNLNPEVDISYEIGLRTQITSNDAFNASAYWKDKYDFISSSSVLIQDATGRDVSRSIRINSDFARVRGIELAYIKRIGKWFNGQVSASYSIATGQSSSSSESLQEILLTGNRETVNETPLAWDSPLDLKAYSVFTVNQKQGLWNKAFLNNFSFYVEAIYRTGKRYTPYLFIGNEEVSGRPIYEQLSDPNQRYSELGNSLFWMDANLKKWWNLKGAKAAFTVEVTNLLNNKNSAIINPVTGRAWEAGDDVPTEWQDPRFIDPRDPRSDNTPPNNPSRYRIPRHLMFGLELGF